MAVPQNILYKGKGGQKGLRIFETLCDFGPVMKTTATMIASPPSPPTNVVCIGVMLNPGI